jgi:hypothetical protein
MEETLRSLRAVHSSSLIMILSENHIRIYDEDVRVLEYISNLISKNNILICNNKYISNIEDLLKKKKINYVILDKSLDYKIYNYYYTYNNNYNKYINLSKKYNYLRKIIIYIYNFLFNIPSNRYR